MKFSTKLTTYIQASYAIIGVETHEESRIIEHEIHKVVKAQPGTELYEWDMATGLVNITNAKKPVILSNTNSDVRVLASIAGTKGRAVFVLKDFHPSFRNPAVVRTLRSLIPQLASSGADAKRQTIILVSPQLDLPIELQKAVQMLAFPLPDREDLIQMLQGFIKDSVNANLTERQVELSRAELEVIAEAAVGMTSTEFCNALAACAIMQQGEDGKCTLTGGFARMIFEEKIINLKNGFLEYLATPPSIDDIGGLDLAKAWAITRRDGYTQRARDLHIPYPKGVMLFGIPGGGKTELAKAIGSIFNFPVFKLDIGKLFGSKVGESESNVREVIRLLEGLGQAVVLLDELEKYLGKQVTSGGGDSGTSSRVFGTLLSWMSEKKCPVFLVATVNDLSALPEALTRKGRWDEVFFVDLPTEQERLAILMALIHRRYKQPKEELDDTTRVDLGRATEGFTGAELDAAIGDALYDRLEQNAKDTEKDERTIYERVLVACRSIKPQSEVNPQYITALREQAKLGYKSASSTEVKTKTRGGKRNLALTA
jgi:AAA+ superfamily predicted ATPase